MAGNSIYMDRYDDMYTDADGRGYFRECIDSTINTFGNSSGICCMLPADDSGRYRRK